MQAGIQLDPRRAALLGALGLGLAGLALALVGFDRRAVGAALAGWDLRLLPAVAACVALALVSRALRARALLPEVAATELVTVIAFAFLPTLLAPGKLGVFVRPLLLRARAGVPLAAALAGAVTERLIDLGALGLITGWVLGAGQPWWIAAGAAVAAIAAWAGRGWIGARLARVGVLPMDRAPLRVAAVLAGTLGFWAAGVGAAAIVLAGAGIDDPLRRGAALAAAGSAAAVGLPVPGAIGVFESAGAAALVGLGVDRDAALAAAVVLHAIQLGANAALAAVGGARLALRPAGGSSAAEQGMAGADRSH